MLDFRPNICARFLDTFEFECSHPSWLPKPSILLFQLLPMPGYKIPQQRILNFQTQNVNSKCKMCINIKTLATELSSMTSAKLPSLPLLVCTQTEMQQNSSTEIKTAVTFCPALSDTSPPPYLSTARCLSGHGVAGTGFKSSILHMQRSTQEHENPD